MALDYSSRKLDRYFDALFVIGRMGNSKKELENLQKIMTPDDYAELLVFDKNHHEMVSLVSKDEDDYIFPGELEKLDAYEKTADNINIAQRYKEKMYECVLIGIDKFDQNNMHSLLLLGKIADTIPAKNRDRLKSLQLRAKHYSFGTNALFEKLNRKIELKLKGKNIKDVEAAKTRFDEISAKLKIPHSTDEKISLLREQLELVNKCALKKMAKFQTKASIYFGLSHEYTCQRDIFNSDEALREAQYYQKLVQNIKNHTK